LPPAVAISHVAAAIVDVLPVPGGPSTARKPYGGRDSACSNPPVCRRSMPSASSWKSWEPRGVCT
jgi:phage baseplate assembly protein W